MSNLKNCELCNAPMETKPRKATKGKYAGQYFIGCTNWTSKTTKHSIINLVCKDKEIKTVLIFF